MTKQERETFLADHYVGIISIPEEGRGPLTVPIWYPYEPGGELRVVPLAQSLAPPACWQIQLSVQTETRPYKYVSVDGLVVAPSSQQMLNAIAGPSLTVTWTRKGVTDTSRRHGLNTLGT